MTTLNRTLRKALAPLVEQLRAQLVEDRAAGATDAELVCLVSTSIFNAREQIKDNPQLVAWLVEQFVAAGKAAARTPPGQRDKSQMQ